jgi:hypothetical protein
MYNPTEYIKLSEDIRHCKWRIIVVPSFDWEGKSGENKFYFCISLSRYNTTFIEIFPSYWHTSPKNFKKINNWRMQSRIIQWCQ